MTKTEYWRAYYLRRKERDPKWLESRNVKARGGREPMSQRDRSARATKASSISAAARRAAIIDAGERTCSQCNVLKPLGEFYLVNGVRISACRTCRSAATTAYEKKNRAAVKIRARAWRAMNRDRLKLAKAVYYQACDKAAIAKRCRARYAKDPAKALAAARPNQMRYKEKQTSEISDKYIAQLWRHSTGLSGKTLPGELITVWRTHIKLTRAIKETRKQGELR